MQNVLKKIFVFGKPRKYDIWNAHGSITNVAITLGTSRSQMVTLMPKLDRVSRRTCKGTINLGYV